MLVHLSESYQGMFWCHISFFPQTFFYSSGSCCFRCHLFLAFSVLLNPYDCLHHISVCNLSRENATLPVLILSDVFTYFIFFCTERKDMQLFSFIFHYLSCEYHWYGSSACSIFSAFFFSLVVTKVGKMPQLIFLSFRRLLPNTTY